MMAGAPLEVPGWLGSERNSSVHGGLTPEAAHGCHARVRYVLRGPFPFPGSPTGDGEDGQSFQRTVLGGNFSGHSGGCGWWIVYGSCPLSASSVFNAEGISVSARNLLLKTWGPNLKLSCFLGLSAEPHGHHVGLSCQAAGFRSQH